MEEKTSFCCFGQATTNATLTLEFAYVLNAGIVHEGIPFFDFYILPPYIVFGIFLYKIGVYDLDLA
jgi:hypothetical protein